MAATDKDCNSSGSRGRGRLASRSQGRQEAGPCRTWALLSRTLIVEGGLR